MSTLDVDGVRKHFPAITDTDQIYFENAGGSQCLASVIDGIRTYLLTNNVQLGASYSVSKKSTSLWQAGNAAAAKYINAAVEETVFGSSTTQLFRNLSQALYTHIQPGDDIIISKLDHEANIASWLNLAHDRQANIIWWSSSSATNPRLEPSDLESLLTPRTKLVTCTHTSNVLGTITDIPAISAVVHKTPDALLVVDAVAYAPHRALDMSALGADFYSFSWYKVYGPHIATLYASKSAQKYLRSLGHFFKPPTNLENLLGLGSGCYEAIAAIPLVVEYLGSQVAGGWEAVARHEEALQRVLLEYLASRPDVYRVWGESGWEKEKRVPVVSFTVEGWKSRDVVLAVERESRFAIRYGAMYSNRLVEEVLGLDAGDGVVRVSLLHYNTVEEVQEFVKVLDRIVKA